MTKSLLYILKLSILPILALVGGRLLGIYLAGLLLGVNIDWSFKTPIDFLNPSVEASQVNNVITFAGLFMYVCLALGMSIVLIQSAFFHDSHLNVPFVSKLAHMNLLTLIKSTYELYHWGFIWGVYLLLGCVIIVIDATQGRTDLWATMIALFFTAFSFTILFKDVLGEIEVARTLTKKVNYERE